jgi:hypothetical protein
MALALLAFWLIEGRDPPHSDRRRVPKQDPRHA